MSSRENIKNLLKRPETLYRIVDSLPVSIDDIRDMVNLSVWGIISKKDKKILHRLLEYYEVEKNFDEEEFDEEDLDDEDFNEVNFDPTLIREYKKIWIKILRFIDSLWTHKRTFIESRMLHMIWISWIALEYFIIDSISRLYKDKKLKIEKWPDELEWKKVDFILNHDGIKLWIQLTLTKLRNQNKKRNEIRNVRNIMNNHKWLENEKKQMSSRYINDVPVLMIINSKISEQTHNNDILWVAFKKWQKNWFPFWWPSVYLSQDNQEELKEICNSLYSTIKTAFDFIRNQYEKWNQDEENEQQIGNMHLIYNKSELEISYYSVKNDWENEPNFIYSLEIFITEKLIKKLLENNKEEI